MAMKLYKKDKKYFCGSEVASKIGQKSFLSIILSYAEHKLENILKNLLSQLISDKYFEDCINLCLEFNSYQRLAIIFKD